MLRLPSPLRSWLELTLVAGTFTILLVYTYALFFRLPYAGFEWDVGQGLITDVWNVQNPGLEVGDRLVSVNSLSIERYRNNLRLELFPENLILQPVTLRIDRAGIEKSLSWQTPGLTRGEFLARLQSQWFIAWVFWLLGLLSFALIRPRDVRWRLLVLFSLLTALWLSASTLSRWHFWWSPIVQRSAIWWCIPVYWHFHWIYPRPLSPWPRPVTLTLYGLAASLSVGEWLGLVPPSFYVVGLGLAVIGAFLLLFVRLFNPLQRASVRPLFVAMLAAFGPTLVLIGLTANGQATITSAAGLLALPALPVFYFYAAYRRQLGTLELRANRTIAAYLFFLGLVTLTGLLASLLNPRGLSTEDLSLAWLVAVILIAGLTLLTFPRFERFVEQRLLGVKLPQDELLEAFSARLVLSPNLVHLGATLERELMPALLIRQSCLLRFQLPDRITIVYAQNVSRASLPPTLKPHTGERLSEIPAELQTWMAAVPWVQLALPLKIHDQFTGLWLLGRRDPDDFYSQRDRASLQVLANQIAIAFAHLEQTERLRQLYEANIDRHESERIQLALHLHDEILNDLAILKTSPDPGEDETAYQRIVQRMRQIIGDLRPVMLTYGLRRAFEQLAEDLSDRAGTAVEIRAALGDEDHRYPATVEQHLFRIVQQAAENALKHAQASSISLTGQLTPQHIQLGVTDNGVGLPPNFTDDLRQLLERRHFGLAGMYERADLADAQLVIRSTPHQGTHVEIEWSLPSATPPVP